MFTDPVIIMWYLHRIYFDWLNSIAKWIAIMSDGCQMGASIDSMQYVMNIVEYSDTWLFDPSMIRVKYIWPLSLAYEYICKVIFVIRWFLSYVADNFYDLGRVQETQ